MTMAMNTSGRLPSPTADAEEMGKAVIRGGDAPVILSDIADISMGSKTPEIGKLRSTPTPQCFSLSQNSRGQFYQSD